MDLNLKKKNYIELFGIDHHQSIDQVLEELSRIEAQPKHGPRIVLMHSNITDEQTKLTDFTYSQLSAYNIDIIGCGHWHLAPKNGAIQEVDKTFFLNPWNLTRVSRDYAFKLDEHRPSFIHGSIVRIGDEWEYSFKDIFLETKPFSEAFNIDVINMLQELGKKNFAFFNEIELNADDIDQDDDLKLLKNIAEANGISSRAVNIAKELLS